MFRLLIVATAFVVSSPLMAQFKNDNVLYKTVYPEDLNQQLKENPGYLLLDVRSSGENHDTSSMHHLNIGHFKGAKNIDIKEVAARLNELQPYKDKPVFVYCSHSQRSRRASKILADSGFTKVYNINGGMTALLQGNYGISDLYETSNKYQLISPSDFCKEVNSKNTFVVDVRSDSAYNATTSDATVNSIGKLKNAVHIPFAELEKSLDKLPKDKKIIVADEYGDEGIEAATLLSSKGYKNVGVLFNGIYNLITSDADEAGCKNEVVQENIKYRILTADEFNQLAIKSNDLVIIDARPVIEYNNQSKDNWRNIGHIKNAINISPDQLQSKLAGLQPSKEKPIVVYASSGDSYKLASSLVDNGFKNVNVLAGGLFNLRWRAANVKGKSSLKDWVTDVPAANL